jgi:hypothetical protein
VQPGNRQPASRLRNARRNAGEIVLVRRPTVSGLPSRSTIRTTAASHPSRLAVSGASAGPSAKWHRSTTSSFSSVRASTCTTTSHDADAPPCATSATAERAIATSASARQAPAGDAA